MSGKLQHIVQQLEIGSKVHHDGFPLWRGWMEGDPKYIRLMEKYCKRDTALLPELYEALLPWISNHPNVVLHDDLDEACCPKCGSKDLEKRGFSYTANAKRQRFHCNNCGSWLTSGKALARTDLRGTK
jgi:RNase P subunit RPR2